MSSRYWYLVLLLALGVQRLLEVRRSQRNAAALLARGGREEVAWQYRAMQVLHSSWFVLILVEVWGLDRPFHPWLGIPAAAVFLGGQALRLMAIRDLGPRWTARLVTLPGRPPVRGGIYRRLRHPNYLGVVLEIAAFPLIHSAYLTAVIISVLNALLLGARIRAEDAALQRAEANAAPG
jgi:methyltransferase